jgi:V/A-type H+-transporting ATPase subunit I
VAIVPLSRITLVGHSAEKGLVLEELQEMGCLELIPLEAEALAEIDPSKRSREALAYLERCPQKQRPATQAGRFDPVVVESEIVALQERTHALELERDRLMQRIDALAPWGDFTFPPREELANYRLWFYIVPRNRLNDLRASDLIWEEVSRDGRYSYVAVISEMEPAGVPAPRIRTGAISRHELEARLEEVELELEDARLDRIRLTRWRTLLSTSLDDLEDRAARSHAAQQCLDSGPVFALQAWVPDGALDHLRSYASERGMGLEVIPPGPDDSPPTLLDNPDRTEGGEDLVNFYKTPGYGSWDPSSVVLFSFAVFFAMIVSDGGYGLLLALPLAHFWKRLGASGIGRRWRWVLLTLVMATIVYGVLVGSYFGVSPPADSFLARFAVLDMTNTTTMMGLSVTIGVLHVALANLMDARRMGLSPAALAPMGWAGVVIGGYLALLSTQPSLAALRTPGGVLAASGLVLVAVFAGHGARPLGRIGKGLAALARLSQAFGDVLSYLRLFALGLASASLAIAFNGMAAGAREAIPGVGLLAALTILVVGHSLNLLLAVTSGFIHGLRLNVIEFFNWGLPDEGSLFRPFRKKGD